MTTRNLLEAATLIESPSEGTWKVRLISEGKGSSGIYSAGLLEQYGRAFNGPTLSFENHPVGWDGPESRNFTQIVGKVVGETWTSTDERGKIGVYANWEPDPDHRARLERYKENLGLSIYIEGDGHVNEDGDFVVDSFNEHDPYKSVDVVIAAGRGGRFEESLAGMYAARRRENASAETSAENGKETKEMDEAKVAELVGKAVADAIAPLVSAQSTKAEEAAQKEADTKAVEEALEAYEAAVKAIDEADLTPEQVNLLRAEAKKGADITAKIAEHKALKASVEKHLTENAGTNGRIVTTDVATVTFTGFGGKK